MLACAPVAPRMAALIIGGGPVDRAERGSGEGDEQPGMGGHRHRHALAAQKTGAHEMERVAGVETRARRTARFPAVAAPHGHPHARLSVGVVAAQHLPRVGVDHGRATREVDRVRASSCGLDLFEPARKAWFIGEAYQVSFSVGETTQTLRPVKNGAPRVSGRELHTGAVTFQRGQSDGLRRRGCRSDGGARCSLRELGSRRSGVPGAHADEHAQGGDDDEELQQPEHARNLLPGHGVQDGISGCAVGGRGSRRTAGGVLHGCAAGHDGNTDSGCTGEAWETPLSGRELVTPRSGRRPSSPTRRS